MNQRFLVLGGLAALLAACGGTFVAQTVTEAFTQYPGDHTITTTGNPKTTANPNPSPVVTAIPLAANDSIAVLVNPSQYKVNGASVSGNVGSYWNPYTATTSARANPQAANHQAVCVGAATANANVSAQAGSQTGFVLHLTESTRNALKTVLDGVCTPGGAGCTNSAPTKLIYDNKAGNTINVSSGEIALRAVGQYSVNPGAGASFQSVKRIKLETVTSGSLTVSPDNEVFLMDLNSALQIVQPQCLPSNP